MACADLLNEGPLPEFSARVRTVSKSDLSVIPEPGSGSMNEEQLEPSRA